MTQWIEFGPYELKTWYYSPYPHPHDQQERLHVCEFTCKYFRKRKTAARHTAALTPAQRHPPGDLIYASPPPSAEWPLSTREAPRITAAATPQASAKGWLGGGRVARAVRRVPCPGSEPRRQR